MNNFAFLIESVDREFRSVKTLKEGARGGVWLMRHEKTGKPFMFRRFQGDGQVYNRLIQITCDYLPEVYETGSEDGETAVLEEYIAGETLAECLQSALFSSAETRKILREVCAGLWTLHSRGIVHRDIKPENVILTPERAVLIDFDAARVEKRYQTEDTQVLGTTGYAAPEQFGISQTDSRADIYALGVMMNVMLTGKHPSVALAKGRMGRIVLKCTMMAPEKRYQSVGDLLKEL